MLSRFLLVAVLVTSPWSFAHGHSDPPIKLIVLGKDVGAGTVPCGSRIFDVVQSAISDRMLAEGYLAFSDIAGPSANRTRRGCNLDDRHLLHGARTPRWRGIGVAIIFEIFPVIRKQHELNWLQARLAGRIVDVRTGQDLGRAEVVSAEAHVFPTSCRGNCLLETVAGHVWPLADDLAVALSLRLGSWKMEEVEQP